MRLAFCFLSNNEHRLEMMSSSFHYDLNHHSNICVDSFTKNVLLNPPYHKIKFYKDWNVEYRIYHWKEAFDMFSMRHDSFAMAHDAEVIFIGDDDFIFKEGSTEIINQCCQYFDNNIDCGAIYLCGNLGGIDKHKAGKIYVNNHPYLGMARGIMTRNRPTILDNRFQALGCGFDALIGICSLMQGYYICRILGVPIEHNKDDNKLLSENQTNINYNLNFMKEKGIWSKLYNHFGKYERGKWPPNIFKHYRSATMIKGFIPKYSVKGEIL